MTSREIGRKPAATSVLHGLMPIKLALPWRCGRIRRASAHRGWVLAGFENELLAFLSGRYDEVGALLLFRDWFAANEDSITVRFVGPISIARRAAAVPHPPDAGLTS
jgi:hypothetical protein